MKVWTLSTIEAEFGQDVAAKAARAVMRGGKGEEPYLTPEELNRLFADLMLDGRDC
jgi:hypothetical protein